MAKWMLAAAALGFIVATASTTLPAAAESVASCRSETVIDQYGNRVDSIEANADMYVAQLRERGYDVDTVQNWGGCVRAFINDPGGRSHMEFFDPDTLEKLTTN